MINMTERHQIRNDKMLTRIDDLTKMVLQESYSQIDKWGIQTHSIFEWITYTTEELGELANAVSEYHYRNGKKEDIVKEAIQTATLSLKIAEMYL